VYAKVHASAFDRDKKLPEANLDLVSNEAGPLFPESLFDPERNDGHQEQHDYYSRNLVHNLG
jgi:hypothetical protein